MGGGKKSKAPATPNYAALQESDALANRQTARELTRWNRPTQVDALGNTLSWYEDPNGNWTQQVTLTPDVRQAQVQGLWGYKNAMDQVTNMGNFQGEDDWYVRQAYNDAVNQNPDFNPNAYGAIGNFDRTQGDRVAADMYEAAMSRLRPEQQRDTAALDNQLRLQGLQPGTEAYNRAAQNLMTSQGDVTAKLGLDSTAAGYNAARDIYNTNLAGQGQRFNQGLQGYQANTAQDWNRFQAANKLQTDAFNQSLTRYNAPLERAQVMAQLNAQAPGANFAGFGTATGYNPADMTGAANATYQAKMGAANAGQGKKNSLLSAGSNLGSAWLMS